MLVIRVFILFCVFGGCFVFLVIVWCYCLMVVFVIGCVRIFFLVLVRVILFLLSFVYSLILFLLRFMRRLGRIWNFGVFRWWIFELLVDFVVKSLSFEMVLNLVIFWVL